MQPQDPHTKQKPDSQQPANYIASAPEYYVPHEFQRIPAGQAHPPRNKKVWVVVILALLLLGGGIAAYSLLQRESTDNDSHNAQTLKQVPAPSEIISGYEELSIAVRDSHYKQRQEVTNPTITDPTPGAKTEQGPSNGVIIYQPEDKYDTAISVTDRVQYARSDSEKTNDETLRTQTKAFLEQTGFTELNKAEMGDGVHLTTYDSKNVICQVSDNDLLESNPATYGLACVDKMLIAKQYASIDALLPLAKDEDLTNIEGITITTTREEQKQLGILTVSTKETTTTLYFATLGTDWEYLGKRPLTNIDDPDSFALPEGLKKTINDPKWGTFLTNVIR